MAKHYYLMNGKNYEGNALNIVSDGYIKKQFNEISELDLATLDIPKATASEVLKEFNTKTNLDGEFYTLQYPFRKTEVKPFATMFSYDNDKAKKVEDDFRYFAEQRLYNFKHGNNLKLENNREFERYIRAILEDVLSSPKGSVIGETSILSANLKKLLIDRYVSYYNKHAYDFMRAKSMTISSFLTNYTQLRNLTIEYLAWKQGIRQNLRWDLNRKVEFHNHGMEYIEPIPYPDDDGGMPIIPVYEQLNIFDFMKDPGYQRVRDNKTNKSKEDPK